MGMAIDDKIGIGDAFADLGIYNWVKGNYAEAIYAYDTAIQIYRGLNKKERIALNFSNFGMVLGCPESPAGNVRAFLLFQNLFKEIM